MIMRRPLPLVAVLAVLALGPGPAHATPVVSQSAGLDVQPFPGTPDASPGTDISFPALSPAQLRAVTVTGSRSGLHRGRLHALPAGRGAAFTPARPFESGDKVTVRAWLRSPAAGSAAGASVQTQISFSFGVRAPLPFEGPRTTEVRHDILDSNGFTHTFRSNPSIHPPLAWIYGNDPDPNASGDIFTDAENSIQAGPLIFSPQGKLVYFQPLQHAAAFDVQVQSYGGQSVLTYWQGYVQHEAGIGSDVILDHTYTPIATVNAGNGYHADLHEFEILPNGDALITAFAQVPNVDLRQVHGPKNGTLLDSIVQEVNIATGQVDWEWHAYGHVRLWESYVGKPGKNPYDFFHINSVQLLPNGNLLVSARHTWTVYEINMKTGKIPYNFGGKNSSFKFERGANFSWQHDAQIQSDGTITVFDDGEGFYKTESQSRALHLYIHYKSHQITLIHAYDHNPPILAQSQGSMQPLPDGNTFVGWGSVPYFTEFSGSGQQLFSIHFDKPLQSYRGFRYQWWGQPTTPPSVAASPAGKGTTVYASWDGATTVAAWQVLAGPTQDPTTMTPVGKFTDTNFETTMSVSSAQPYFAVQALGSRGQVLATSAGVPR